MSPFLKRNRRIKDERKKYLIFCEGKNTEPSYFKLFRLLTIQLVPVGTWMNTTSLVRYATSERAKREEKWEEFDEVWCIFDGDPKPDNPKQVPNFDQAVSLAEKNEIFIGYSYEAFEYWIILHFEDHQWGDMSRNDYEKKLNGYTKPLWVEFSEKKWKLISNELFNLCMWIDPMKNKIRVDIAIERAKRNDSSFNCCGKTSERGSSTTIYKLVEKLLKDM